MGERIAKRRGSARFVELCAGIAALAILVITLAAPALRGQAQKQQTPQTPQKPQGGMPFDLVGGLRATPGCLGVELARTASGKQVIFAWFADKQAVLRWYNSETHAQAMNMISKPEERQGPLKQVPDDIGPILAIASITPSEKQAVPGFPAAISQVAIELYRPVPGGIVVGGRFSPAALAVPGMREYPLPAANK